ncbi:MAG: macro domain-containing protein [Candidatus Omnitrophica bacterium]|nr:macro domain-containing protein [Candidatus Omnitrophota bacterium]MDD5429814.1 macro domain-containing protein [Candidatus Omnitrophota bacterium]
MNIDGIEITVYQGDITEDSSQAIVNAANNRFVMGGGLAGIIKRKGGQAIEDEAVKKGPMAVGGSVITSAGTLPADYIIHSVTMTMPDFSKGERFRTDEKIIRKSAHSALRCAQENKISSIAFCALGCGVGRFPYEAASKIMAQEVFRYIQETQKPALKQIRFVLNAKEPFEIFRKNVIDYLKHMDRKIHKGPFLTVDGLIEYKDGLVMIERSNPPLGWALPGGFVDYGESLEEAIVREIKEETNLNFVDFRQFKVYSDASRDPRFHTVSAVFFGRGEGKLEPGSDAKGAKVVELNSLPEETAFDHKKIIEDYLKARK